MKRCSKRERRIISLGLVWALLGLFACKSTQAMKQNLEASRSQNDASAFPWQIVAEGEFITHALAPRIGTVKSRPMQDPLRQRLQFWLNQLDTFLREKDPNSMKHVPKPQIFLLDNAASNAFVASMEVCLNRTAQMQGADGTSEDFLGIDRELGGFFTVAGPRPCVKLPYQGAELQKFLDWYLEPFPGCHARVSPRAADFAASCLQASVDGANTPAQTREVFVRVSGHWIVVTTGLMKDLTEFEAVYTVFHEAAHYYMAHLSHPSSLYHSFQTRASTDAKRQTIDDPRVAELGQELLYWLKAKEAGPRKFAEGAPDQRYHSGLYLIARNMVQDWIRKEGTRTACKDLSQHVLSASGLQSFPVEAPDSLGQQSYRLYEQKVDACLAPLALDRAMQDRMIAYTRLIAPWSNKVLVQVPSFTSVKPFWDWLHASIPALMAAPETRLAELSQRADALGLGHFTNEEEAEGLAIEWLTNFDIDPRQALSATLKRLKSSAPRPGTYTYEQCRRAVATNFRAADGSELRVPVGDYSDPHQSGCYRAFNVHRTISAPTFSSPSLPRRVTAPSPAWDTLAR